MHAELCIFADINEEWDDGLDTSQRNISELAEKMGVMSEDGEQLDALVKAADNLVQQQKQCLEEERKLFEISVEHQETIRNEV